MKFGFFITGTDTNAGKTWLTIALMRRFRQLGYSVAGMKPVAAGCEWQDGAYKNADALLIQANCSHYIDYRLINPYAFQQPYSPHLACGETVVEMAALLAAYGELQHQAEILIVEGAGGWFSPLSRELDNATLAKTLQLPVLLAVGMRLGCINHSRLTQQAIHLCGLDSAGWAAMELEPDRADLSANISYLHNALNAPFLGLLPFSPAADFDSLARCLLIETVIGVKL